MGGEEAVAKRGISRSRSGRILIWHVDINTVDCLRDEEESTSAKCDMDSLVVTPEQ